MHSRLHDSLTGQHAQHGAATAAWTRVVTVLVPGTGVAALVVMRATKSINPCGASGGRLGEASP